MYSLGDLDFTSAIGGHSGQVRTYLILHTDMTKCHLTEAQKVRI